MKTFFTLIALLCLSFSLFAQTPFSAQTEGERLERLWWEQQKSQDIAGLTKLMSPAFQSINSKGAQDLAFNMAIIKAEKLGKYELSNIKGYSITGQFNCYLSDSSNRELSWSKNVTKITLSNGRME